MLEDYRQQITRLVRELQQQAVRHPIALEDYKPPPKKHASAWQGLVEEPGLPK